AGIAGVSVLALPALAQSRAEGPSSAAVQVAPGITATYSFTTLDDSADLTFNQLLGINDLGKIAGYFGSGMSAAHPNQGYTISAYSGTTFTSENYPGSVQTQVTGLNDMGKTVGFYVDAAGNNFGFYMKNGVFSSFSAPGAGGKTRTTQLLGVNNEGMAVGFYNDAKGNAHGFELDTKTGAYSQLRLSGAVQLTASAINDDGDVAGFFVDAKNITKSFVVENGMVETLAVPGASATQAFGINDSDEVVGQYTLGKATHGFLWQNGRFVTIDDPAGQGTTTVNGINNLGDLVGFYTDSANNTDGFVAQPQYLHTGA
ncbi:MAG TPA: hypothetical protein VMD59_09965, partial [Acidimicrobiales bacterium]|nr:hypothetical protein [Acidimicrobiales bacterium]